MSCTCNKGTYVMSCTCNKGTYVMSCTCNKGTCMSCRVHVYYRFQNVSSLYRIVHGIHQLQTENSKVLYLILNYISLFTNAIFLSGDILYIDVIIMEGDEYCITATPSGFFLNRSIPGSKFDPHPRKIAHHSQHLVTLLQQVHHLLYVSVIISVSIATIIINL